MSKRNKGQNCLLCSLEQKSCKWNGMKGKSSAIYCMGYNIVTDMICQSSLR